MDKVSEKLTVYFEEPFWVGTFERVDNGTLSVCKVTCRNKQNLNRCLNCNSRRKKRNIGADNALVEL